MEQVVGIRADFEGSEAGIFSIDDVGDELVVGFVDDKVGFPFHSKDVSVGFGPVAGEVYFLELPPEFKGFAVKESAGEVGIEIGSELGMADFDLGGGFLFDHDEGHDLGSDPGFLVGLFERCSADESLVSDRIEEVFEPGATGSAEDGNALDGDFAGDDGAERGTHAVAEYEDVVFVDFRLGFELKERLAVDVDFRVEIEVCKWAALAVADSWFFDADGDVSVFGEVVEDWTVNGLDISG